MQINIYHNGQNGGVAKYNNVKYCEVLPDGAGIYFTHVGEAGIETIQTTLPYKIITEGDVKPY
jgi:hypothetical protein